MSASMDSDGNTSFLLMSSALVFIMIPGLGYFYSGLTSQKSALSILLLSYIATSVILVQWFICGYSLVYATDGSGFIGTFSKAFYSNVDIMTEVPYPEYAFAFFQATFACIAPALVIGGAADRARILPKIVFVFIWSFFVYDPIAYWCWNDKGWLHASGALDFAGGSPVHISSGFAALAYVLMVGQRKTKRNSTGEPYSPVSVVLGTLLLWFGWNGFNGGSALQANGRASAAIVATNLAAASASITWMIMDFMRKGKISSTGFCCGAICGLVAITPCAGFVSPTSAIFIGHIGSVCCFLSGKIKERLKFDDTLDVFSVHGIGGVVGNILNGIFTERYWPSLDGTQIMYSGIIEGEYRLLGWQIVDSMVCAAWSFCWTCAICYALNKIPGLQLSLSDDDYEQGLDSVEMGETTFEYIKIIEAKKGFKNPELIAKRTSISQ